MKKYFLVGLSIIVVYLLGSMIVNQVILVDDLGIFFNNSFTEVMRNFNFTSRPVSGFFTGVLAELSGGGGNWYIYLAYIFLIMSFFLIYKSLKLYTKNEVISILGVIMYVILPIGTSSFYSLIMFNSSIAISCYCLSLIFLKKDYNTKNLLLSSLFFILSFLSYEICLPLLLFNLLMIDRSRFKNFKGYLIYLILCFLIPVSFYFIYKNILEDLFFGISLNREEPHQIFNIQRDIQVIIRGLFSYSMGLMVSFLRAIVAIKFYSYIDFLLLMLVNGLFILGVKRINFKKDGLNKILLFSLFGFLLANTIFFLSNYLPTPYYFDNRTMAMCKLLYGIIIIVLIHFIARYSQKIAKGILVLVLVIFSIFTISVKNAWVYANTFNNNLFQKVKTLIQSLPEKDRDIYNLAIDYDKRKIMLYDEHFILREPFYGLSYETSKLADINNFKDLNKISESYKGSLVSLNSSMKSIPKNFAIDLEKFPYYYIKPFENKIFIVRTREDFFNAIKSAD